MGVRGASQPACSRGGDYLIILNSCASWDQNLTPCRQAGGRVVTRPRQ
jgi:hypothetical protein